MFASLRARLPQVHRELRRRRRTFTVLAVFALIVVALPRVIPTPVSTILVPVAAVDLAAGEVIQAHQVTEIEMPAHVMPTEIRKDDLVGHELAFDIPSGTALLPSFLRENAPLDLPSDSAMMAIDVPIALHASLHPGDRIGIVYPRQGDGSPTTVTATVVDTSPMPDPSATELGGGSSFASAAVLVALSEKNALDVAHAHMVTELSFYVLK